MILYHYIDKKLRSKRHVEPGVSIETVFKETQTWPGTKLILVKG